MDECIAFLLEQQFYKNVFLLTVFILVLRDRYSSGTVLWEELNNLYQAVNDEVSQKRQQSQFDPRSPEGTKYGELVEATVEITETRNTQLRADPAINDIPAIKKKDRKTEKSVTHDKKNFFISYNSHDKQWAEWIAWQLEEEGYTTIIQAWDFRPGTNFVAHMDNAAASAERTIAVLSPDYVASKFTKPEWNAAFAQDPTGEKGLLLPIRVRECELKGLLQQIVYIDLVGKLGEVARTTLLAGITSERAKPTTAPGFPTNLGTQGEIKNEELIEFAVEKKQLKPNTDLPKNDVPALSSRIAKIYGKNASRLLATLSEQINETKPQSAIHFNEWLIKLVSSPKIPEIGQDLETWLVITLEQYIRLIGVDNMSEIFSQYYEEFPPTDRHAAFLIEKAAIEIESSMLSMAICREDNRKIQIGAKFIEESQTHLEKMENTIQAVLDLFNRYTPPDTILPEELRHERIFDAIANYGRVLDGINAHIAMRGKLAHEYKNDIERNYDDLVIYAGGFIEWLKELANRASRANRYL